MDPLTMALIFAGGSALSGIGSAIQARQPYEDTLSGFLKGYNARLGAPESNRDLNWARSNDFYKRLTGGGALDPTSYLQRATGYAGDASGLYNQVVKGLGAGGAFTAKGMQKTFAGLSPELQALSAGVANDATSRAGASMAALAQAVSNRQLSNMQNRMAAGGLFGAAAGPVAASLAHGAQEPLMQAQTAIDQMYNNSYMGAYNPMAAFSMQNIQAQPTAMANMGQLYQSLAEQQYGAANPLLAALAGQSEQAILAPDLQKRTSGLASFLQGLGNAGAQFGSFGLGKGWTAPTTNPKVYTDNRGIPWDIAFQNGFY
jgi:hypothetical protein